jgi:hypothetical protein
MSKEGFYKDAGSENIYQVSEFGAPLIMKNGSG